MNIQMNPGNIEKVKSMLSGLKSVPEKVMSRAINLSLTGVKTDASTEIRAIITPKKNVIDATFRTTKATVTSMKGSFFSTGKNLGLIDFSARQTVKGVTVQVKKTTPRKLIPGTFIATMKSGHKGVFWRVWHGGTHRVKKQMTYARLPKFIRLPIHELFAPAVPDYLGEKGPVYAKVEAKATARLHTNMEHELNFELSKL